MGLWGCNDLITIHIKAVGTIWLVNIVTSNAFLNLKQFSLLPFERYFEIILVILDKLEDFYNLPYPVGSLYKGFGDLRRTEFSIAVADRREAYASDIQSAYARLENGTYTFYESRQSLRYLMRNQFTNE